MIPLSSILPVAIEAARQSGKVLLSYYGKVESIQNKQIPGDLVTEADVAAEKTLLTFLQQHFPDHAFLGEESGSRGTSPWQWVVDPLDGTTNFAHQHPCFAVSIALLHRDNPILGVVYNPLFDELFDAATGLGARCNGKGIHVSSTNSLRNSLLATGFPYDRLENRDNNYTEFCLLTDKTQGVRRCGSAALDLAYTAMGRYDGYWEKGVKPWDVAAGIVLVREAGGRVTRYDGTELDNLREGRFLASNGLIHRELSDALREAATQRRVEG